MEIAIVVGLVVVLVIALVIGMNAARRLSLLARYNDDHKAVDMIMSRRIWEGMTSEQLIESWGRPAEIDERVLKTKVAQVYKYGHTGKNAFRERVKLDDGVVVGWDQRDKR
jgi:hypothetical protein